MHTYKIISSGVKAVYKSTQCANVFLISMMRSSTGSNAFFSSKASLFLNFLRTQLWTDYSHKLSISKIPICGSSGLTNGNSHCYVIEKCYT